MHCLKVTPSGTLASPHSSEDDSDCHNGGQSKGLSCISFFTFLEYKTCTFSIDHSSPCNRAHQNDCVEVGGIDSGCTVLEDCSVSVKRDTIRKVNYFVYSRGMYYLYITYCSF